MDSTSSVTHLENREPSWTRIKPPSCIMWDIATPLCVGLSRLTKSFLDKVIKLENDGNDMHSYSSYAAASASKDGGQCAYLSRLARQCRERLQA